MVARTMPFMSWHSPSDREVLNARGSTAGSRVYNGDSYSTGVADERGDRSGATKRRGRNISSREGNSPNIGSARIDNRGRNESCADYRKGEIARAATRTRIVY